MAVNCNDNNKCTTDWCDPNYGCHHTAIAGCGTTAYCGNGVCDAGETVLTCPTDCIFGGSCGANPAQTCNGYCGYQAPSGCYCDAACVNNNDCCPDKAACGCP